MESGHAWSGSGLWSPAECSFLALRRWGSWLTGERQRGQWTLKTKPCLRTPCLPPFNPASQGREPRCWWNSTCCVWMEMAEHPTDGCKRPGPVCQWPCTHYAVLSYLCEEVWLLFLAKRQTLIFTHGCSSQNSLMGVKCGAMEKTHLVCRKMNIYFDISFNIHTPL